MPETGFTYSQVQELIKTAVDAAIGAANRMNPIEQRKFDEELDREHRRNQMVAQLGRIEEEATNRKRNGCTHMRYGMGAGKHAGEMAPRGASNAEWMTGGQAHQNGLATLVCTRCSTAWLFKPTPDYYNAILQNGLWGEAPPSDEHVICVGCFEYKKSCKCAEIYAASKADKNVQ